MTCVYLANLVCNHFLGTAIGLAVLMSGHFAFLLFSHLPTKHFFLCMRRRYRYEQINTVEFNSTLIIIMDIITSNMSKSADLFRKKAQERATTTFAFFLYSSNRFDVIHSDIMRASKSLYYASTHTHTASQAHKIQKQLWYHSDPTASIAYTKHIIRL